MTAQNSISVSRKYGNRVKKTWTEQWSDRSQPTFGGRKRQEKNIWQLTFWLENFSKIIIDNHQKKNLLEVLEILHTLVAQNIDFNFGNKIPGENQSCIVFVN